MPHAINFWESLYKPARGEIEIILKDTHGNIIDIMAVAAIVEIEKGDLARLVYE